jgi:hypothetical protein
LVDHVWRNDGDAEVICIVRPRAGTHSPSDVFVLQGTGREFVEHLSKSQSAPAEPSAPAGKQAAAQHTAAPTTRSDVATLPASTLTR